jgi:hypothetical protein
MAAEEFPATPAGPTGTTLPPDVSSYTRGKGEANTTLEVNRRPAKKEREKRKSAAEQEKIKMTCCCLNQVKI